MNNNVEYTEIEARAISVIESVLFSSDKPVSLDLLHQAIAYIDKNLDVKDLINKYKAILQSDNRGVYVDMVCGKYQIRTKKTNSEILKNINKSKQFRLSAPAMEVLAIVTYEQPCIKARIDEVRGVDSGHLIRVLMDKGLVCFAGKSDLLGKPMLYKTTRKFLETFSLKNLKNLPSLSEFDELVPDELEQQKRETLSELTSRLDESNKKDISLEGDLEKIGQSLSEIKVTTIESDNKTNL